jgi:hypothetical protein
MRLVRSFTFVCALVVLMGGPSTRAVDLSDQLRLTITQRMRIENTDRATTLSADTGGGTS